MVGRCITNSGHGGPPGTRVMTIFVSYVSAQIPNIEYFEVYGGLLAPGGISSLFSSNFPSNGVRIRFGDPFLTRVTTIFINVTILEINVYIYMREGKKGRDKGKGKSEGKKGREERKGKREAKKVFWEGSYIGSYIGSIYRTLYRDPGLPQRRKSGTYSTCD